MYRGARWQSQKAGQIGEINEDTTGISLALKE